jgi:hypothetical protein
VSIKPRTDAERKARVEGYAAALNDVQDRGWHAAREEMVRLAAIEFPEVVQRAEQEPGIYPPGVPVESSDRP